MIFLCRKVSSKFFNEESSCQPIEEVHSQPETEDPLFHLSDNLSILLILLDLDLILDLIDIFLLVFR